MEFRYVCLSSKNYTKYKKYQDEQGFNFPVSLKTKRERNSNEKVNEITFKLYIFIGKVIWKVGFYDENIYTKRIRANFKKES